jgi:hypothetical protein
MTVHATQQSPRPGQLPGPGAPGRIAALRPWSAFDRRFFRLAALPAFLAVYGWCGWFVSLRIEDRKSNDSSSLSSILYLLFSLFFFVQVKSRLSRAF